MKKLDQLTFTRFIAAFMVLVFHGGAGLFPFNFFPVVPLLSSGQTAVSYFFVLSGFVMALAYYRPEKRFDFRSYWTARFSRIYPIYILAFLLTALYYLELMAKMKSPKIWANIFLYQAWVPRYSQSFNMAAWSLSVEAFFYIIFPFLAMLMPRFSTRRIVGFSLGFWVVSQLLHSVLYMQMMPEGHLLLLYFPIFHLSSFLLGVSGGVWYLAKTPNIVVDQKTNRRWLLLALALVALALMGRTRLPALFVNFSLDVGLLAPFFLLIVLTLALDTTKVSRWLSRPQLVLLGDASYALYILHVPVRWWIERGLAAMGNPVSFGTMYYFYMPSMIALSVAVFVWIERPLRDWFRHNMNRLPLMVMDILLAALAVGGSFALRLGSGQETFEHARLFALRVAPCIYFAALIAFRFYGTARPVWRSLGPAIALGAGILTGFMYLAWQAGWVEGFSRTILLLNAAMTFGLLYGSRVLLNLWRPKPVLAEKQA
jgi:peptidoglycan/LPS O-acetylase OafA/YrhL